MKKYFTSATICLQSVESTRKLLYLIPVIQKRIAGGTLQKSGTHTVYVEKAHDET
jgi:hypothetical protein